MIKYGKNRKRFVVREFYYGIFIVYFHIISVCEDEITFLTLEKPGYQVMLYTIVHIFHELYKNEHHFMCIICLSGKLVNFTSIVVVLNISVTTLL